MTGTEQKLTPHDEQLVEDVVGEFARVCVDTHLVPGKAMANSLKTLTKNVYLAGVSEGRRQALQLIVEKYARTTNV
jgi:hypothetical protein